MKDKGSAGDVASASSALKRRAASLLEFDADRGLTERTSLGVHFNDVEWLYRGNISLLGSISIGDQTLGELTRLMQLCCMLLLSTAIWRVIASHQSSSSSPLSTGMGSSCCVGQLSLLPPASTGQEALAMLCSWEGNRRSCVAPAMRRENSVTGFNGLRTELSIDVYASVSILGAQL